MSIESSESIVLLNFRPNQMEVGKTGSEKKSEKKSEICSFKSFVENLSNLANSVSKNNEINNQELANTSQTCKIKFSFYKILLLSRKLNVPSQHLIKHAQTLFFSLQSIVRSCQVHN